MTSPIHKFLFSPPPSPPSESETGADYPPLKALVTGLAPRSSSKPPTPRLGDSEVFPHALPLPPMRAPSPHNRAPSPRRLFHQSDFDVEAAGGVGKGGAAKSFSQRSPLLAKLRLIIQRFTPNLPRPVLRLFAFVAFLFIFASFVSSVILPALSPLHSRQVAKKPQWTPKAYVPPQANAHPLVAPNPRAFRPDPHTLPPSHELLALQSFVLESSANSIGDVDSSVPLDAADLLGTHAARRLGSPGSPREKQWLKEITDDNAHSVVLWYSSIQPPHYALEGISARHGEGRRATLIATAQRKDGETIEAIFARLGHDLSTAPVLVIGGEVFDATPERMAELRESGDLTQRLAQIGWSD